MWGVWWRKTLPLLASFALPTEWPAKRSCGNEYKFSSVFRWVLDGARPEERQVAPTILFEMWAGSSYIHAPEDRPTLLTSSTLRTFSILFSSLIETWGVLADAQLLVVGVFAGFIHTRDEYLRQASVAY